MDVILLIFVAMIGCVALYIFYRCFRKRGEDCPDYPHKCPWCPHAPECIIEIGRKKL
jgi:hypothetical protein